MQEPSRWTPNDWIRITALVGALGLFGLGSWMLFQGIAAEGSIDLKSSVLSGTIKASSAGLYVCFFALFIIVFVLTTLLAPTRARATTSTATRTSKLMPVFWGLLGALGAAVVSAAVLPEGARTGISIALGVLTMSFTSVVFAIIRAINDDA
jgi:hypothetical protein